MLMSILLQAAAGVGISKLGAAIGAGIAVLVAVFACRNTDIKTIVATGSVATLPQAEELLGAVGNLCGVKFIIPKEAQYATAIGAASLRFDD